MCYFIGVTNFGAEDGQQRKESVGKEKLIIDINGI
jgi:hypothetical protein